MNKPTNTHGGSRLGAGRPKSPPTLIDIEPTSDPLQFLQVVMNDDTIDLKHRAAAAVALLPFVHSKKNALGKKNERIEAAKKASTGKYAATPPPMRLVS